LGFAYRLHVKLGLDGNVWRWLRSISWHQFREWLLFEEANGPVDESRHDATPAIVGSVLTNQLQQLNYTVSCFMAGKESWKIEKPKPIKPEDLIPRYGRQPHETKTDNQPVKQQAYYDRFQAYINERRQQAKRNQANKP